MKRVERRKLHTLHTLHTLRTLWAPVVLLAVLLAALGGTLAWFHASRGISTPSAIMTPTVLDIRGKDRSEVTGITFNDLTLTGNAGSTQFLFCIVGVGTHPYEIELAHTTNVDLTYNLYPAQQSAVLPTGWLQYTAESTVNPYCYDAVPLQLYELNRDLLSETVAAKRGDAYYGKTYRNTDTVQTAAIPLFKISNAITPVCGNDEEFVDYYVLEVSWDSISQSKETDMVYLLAQLAN